MTGTGAARIGKAEIGEAYLGAAGRRMARLSKVGTGKAWTAQGARGNSDVRCFSGVASLGRAGKGHAWRCAAGQGEEWLPT